MNYEKLSGSIRAVIDRRPGDNGAYSDLFSLCREWETENFSAAHKVNKELLALSADQVVRGGGAKFYNGHLWYSEWDTVDRGNKVGNTYSPDAYPAGWEEYTGK